MINSCVSQTPWLYLTGNSAGELGKIFLGPRVTVVHDKKVEAEAKVPSNAVQTREEFLLKVDTYETSLLMTTCDGGDTHKPGKAATFGVATQKGSPRIFIPSGDGAVKCIKVLKSYRIVLLGEEGVGKSSLGNKIFGDDVFKMRKNSKPYSSGECQLKARSVHGKRITILDTPGFDNLHGHIEAGVKDEILAEISAWLPHTFLIVLNVKNFTEEKKSIIDKMSQVFSDTVFKFAIVVFTHADRLTKGVNIEQFVDENKCLKDLVTKCSSRYHVVDKRSNQDNQLQISKLLHTVEKMVMGNKGGCYTNMLQENKRKTQKSTILPPREGEKKTNTSACMRIKLSGPAGDIVAEAIFGPAIVQKNPKGKYESETEVQEGSDSNPEEDKEAEISKEAEATNESKPKEVNEEEGQAEEVRQDGGGGSFKAKKEVSGKPEEDPSKLKSKRKGNKGVLGRKNAAPKIPTLPEAGSTGLPAGLPGSQTGAPGQAAGSSGSAAGTPGEAAGSSGSAAGTPEPAAGSSGPAEGSMGLAPGTAAGSTAPGIPGQVAGSTGLAVGTTAAIGAGIKGLAGSGLAKKIQSFHWLKKYFVLFCDVLIDAKQHAGVILLAVAFYLLLGLSLYAKVSGVETILLDFGIPAMFLLIVVLFATRTPEPEAGSSGPADGSMGLAPGTATGSTAPAPGISGEVAGSTGLAGGPIAAMVAGIKRLVKFGSRFAKIIQYFYWLIKYYVLFRGVLIDAKQHAGVILLAVAFYLLLGLSFCAQVSGVGTILLDFGIPAMFMLIVVLFLII